MDYVIFLINQYPRVGISYQSYLGMEDNFFQLSVGRTSYLRGVSVVELGVVGAHLDLSEVEVHELGYVILCEI